MEGEKTMAVQFSDEIVDKNVAPFASKITKCGAPLLRANDNYFAKYLFLASFAQKKFKPHIHALLVVFHRRVDFACVAYRQGRRRLLAYSKNPKNSNTRLVRLAISFFETCAVHAVAATLCAGTIVESLKQAASTDDRVNRLRLIANSVRHFDEEVFGKKDNRRIQKSFGISPVWVTNVGVACKKAEVTFVELRSVLKELLDECNEFNKILQEP
jgi:hypothetical protein